jgi:hypothetical protein
VPADHLRLFPGVTPQLHRTKGTALRIDTTNSETGNQTMEKETSPGCTCIEGIFCSGRGTDRTRAGWTRKKEGISARTNLTDIYVLGGSDLSLVCVCECCRQGNSVAECVAGGGYFILYSNTKANG